MKLPETVVYMSSFTRAKFVCEAMADGIMRQGYPVRIQPLERVQRDPIGDFAIFYGQDFGGKELMQRYLDEGKHSIYIDLGYWGRLSGGRFNGYHKIALDGLHPNDVQLSMASNNNRYASLNVHIHSDYGKGEYILLAGLSGKGAKMLGLSPYEWEQNIIAQIKTVTDRPIVYRPKPSWTGAKPIPGTIFSPPEESLEDVLRNTHCVVTRHSNVSVDALCKGIPVFMQDGAAKDICYGLDELDKIESCECPSEQIRQDLFIKMAYCQWNLNEMKQGLPWEWLMRNLQ